MQKFVFYSICISEIAFLGLKCPFLGLKYSTGGQISCFDRLFACRSPLETSASRHKSPLPRFLRAALSGSPPSAGRPRAPGAGRGAEPLPFCAQRPSASRGLDSQPEGRFPGRDCSDQTQRGQKPEWERMVSVGWSSAAERSRSGFHLTVTRRWLQLPDMTALLGTRWIQMSGSITLSTEMLCIRDAVK